MQGQTIKCRAAVSWEPSAKLVIEDITVPPPGPHEIRMKVAAAALCHSDISKWRHIIKPLCSFPLILGHEGAGTVESVGAGITDVKPGDKVISLYFPNCGKCPGCNSKRSNTCDWVKMSGQGLQRDGKMRVKCKGQELRQYTGLGLFAEYCIVQDYAYIKVPDDAPLDKVCLIPCCISTGFGACVNTAKVEAGDNVAVFGLGAIGLAAIMGAKAAGAANVVAVDINEKKFGKAKELGATECLNPLKCENKPTEEVLKEKFGGKGVDAAIECVGNVEVMRTAFESTHPNSGITVVMGLDKAEKKLCLDPSQLTAGRIITGSYFGGYRARESVPQMVKDYMSGNLNFDPLITHHKKLEDINECIDLLLSGESIRSVIHF